MYFNPNNIYLLTDVVSKYQNPVHDELIGRLCRLEQFEPETFGWFKAEFDDGLHRIRTSIVKDVGITEPEHDVILTTTNSVYTFSMVQEQEHAEDNT